jgi:hypothetical protein
MKRDVGRMAFWMLLMTLLAGGSLHAGNDRYRSPDQVGEWVRRMVASHPGVFTSTIIATSPGDRPVYLIEIGNETGSSEKLNPSVFVGANFEGTRPLATEGALYLAELILSDPGRYDHLNWYIVPVGNPDAASRYFHGPLNEDARNDLPANDDRDEQTDEDGVNDLNQDGWITLMRVRDPDGKWIISEKDERLMQKADPDKGEHGVFQILTEGIDEDGDGLFNEDGPGGTNVNLNFPFLFENFTETGGLYPGSTPESFGVMKFVFEHPDIAMIFSFGATNFCMVPPEGGRPGEADLNHLRVSERQASMFGLDPSRTYTMEELVKEVRAAYPQEEIDESDIAGFLELGAAVNPQEGDLVFYKKYAEAYKDFLEDQGFSLDRFGPSPAREGSFELWGYFHVGLPVFSMDLWGVPRPPLDSAQVKDPGSKPKGGGPDGEKQELELALLAWSDSSLNGAGFAPWESFDHPDLGPVEIGGFIPYVTSTPPSSMVDSLLAVQVPWVFELAGALPDLKISDTKVTALGEGISQLEVWVENRSSIPFPTYMGKRNKHPAPAVLIMEGKDLEFLSGYGRTPVQSVSANSKVKLKWILNTRGSKEILLHLESRNAGRDQRTIKIGG